MKPLKLLPFILSNLIFLLLSGCLESGIKSTVGEASVTAPDVAEAIIFDYGAGPFTYQNGVLFFVLPTITSGTGLTFAVSSGMLPPGLSIDPSTGIISGTPTGTINADGSDHTVVISASGVAGSTLVSLSLREIGPPRFAYTKGRLEYFRDDPTGVRTDLYAGTPFVEIPVIEFCRQPCTYLSSSLPPFLNLDSTAGYITSGTINSLYDNFTFNVELGDVDGLQTSVIVVLDEVCNNTGSVFAGHPFGGGAGSPGDPYLICRPNHVASIDDAAGAFLSRSFSVEDDIDFGGANLDPIGMGVGCFKGSLDGKGHILKAFMHLNVGAFPYTGFFYCLEDFGIIQDLVLQKVDYRANSNTAVGGLAGYLSMPGPNFNLIQNTIQNVSLFQVQLGNDQGFGSAVIGGLLGITDCSVSAVGQILSIKNSIFHGEIFHGPMIDSSVTLGAITVSRGAPGNNCLTVDNSVSFFKAISYPDGLNLGVLTATPIFIEAQEMTNPTWVNPNVLNHVIVNLDSGTAYPQGFATIMMQNLSMSNNSVTLADPAFWTSRGFDMTNGFKIFDPAATNFSVFSSGPVGIITPQALCDPPLNSCLP